MSRTEADGGMCLHCGEINSDEDLDKHLEKLNLEKGDRFRFTEKVPEGMMTVTSKVRHKVGMKDADEHPPHYQVTIQKATVDGEDKTEEYLEKAFDGNRKRGIPLEKICNTEIEVIE